MKKYDHRQAIVNTILVSSLIPKAGPEGFIICPKCCDGQIYWIREKQNMMAVCSTPHCVAIMKQE